MITAYFDGCCEPKNPGGTAAYGVVIFDNEKRIYEASKVFKPIAGKEKWTSNNVAEYSGFLDALGFLKSHSLHTKEIMIHGDSKLVICQMFGDVDLLGKKWRILKGFYKPLAVKAQKELQAFSNIKAEWIPREENTIADKLSKAELKNNGVVFKIQPE
jgi:ribonuclease HI